MKHCIAAAILTLLFVSFAFTQTNANRGIVLTGTVVSVKPLLDLEKADKINFLSPSPDDFLFDVEIYLQFRNETDKPLIVFLPDRFFGQKKIAFLNPSKSNSDQSYTVIPPRLNRYPKGFDPFPHFAQYLDDAEPSKSVFAIIEPRGYYECHESLRVKTGYRVEIKSGRRLSQAPAIPEEAALRLKYQLSSSDRRLDSDALRTAKRNWKTFGELPLDSNGDYSVESEVILNKLSE